MGEIVHRINAPFIPRSVMRHLHNAIDNGIAHIKVGGGHINFSAENFSAVFKLAVGHTPKQIKIFLHRTVTVGTLLSRLGQSAAILTHLVGGEVANKGKTLFNKFQGTLINIVKIVGSIVDIVPMITQPFYIFHNGVNIFNIFLGGIGIIKTKITTSAVLFGSTEVNADCLCVTDMQIAVRFGRKTGLNSGINPFL